MSLHTLDVRMRRCAGTERSGAVTDAGALFSEHIGYANCKKGILFELGPKHTISVHILIYVFVLLFDCLFLLVSPFSS